MLVYRAHGAHAAPIPCTLQLLSPPHRGRSTRVRDLSASSNSAMMTRLSHNNTRRLFSHDCGSSVQTCCAHFSGRLSRKDRKADASSGCQLASSQRNDPRKLLPRSATPGATRCCCFSLCPTHRHCSLLIFEHKAAGGPRVSQAAGGNVSQITSATPSGAIHCMLTVFVLRCFMFHRSQVRSHISEFDEGTRSYL